MEDSDNEQEKKNERMHLNDAIMEHLHVDNIHMRASEAGVRAQEKSHNSSAIGSETGAIDHPQANVLPAQPEAEISHFLKIESHSETPEHQVLDSASVVHGIGHMLRNARIARNMSMEEVSRQLRISVQQVEA
ncbi:MAG: helix-turn-helix domain-containing protein, partial [Nitrosomonas sp.]|nr:helix-turn-helix domain-containing protein [Nitrosomonas sp.]